MFHSKPVVVTHSISLREFVEDNQCGLWYHDKDLQELAKVISQLADPDVAQRYGRKGHEAVQSKLNWAADADVLNDFVATILEHGPRD
jgi:glycosyltransferase involved in cell wall biosynthesis